MKKYLYKIKTVWRILTRRNIFYVAAIAEDTRATAEDVCKALIRYLNQQLYNAQISEEDNEAALARYQMIESILNDRSVILLSMHHYNEPEHPEEVVPTIINDCETDEDFETLSTLNID